MLDRTDFESWQQRIRCHCLGKDNGENIMKSITKGPFQMGMFIQTPFEETEGALQLGPERAIRNNARGNVVAGNVGGQNRVGNMNPDYFNDKKLLDDAHEIVMTIAELYSDSNIIPSDQYVKTTKNMLDKIKNQEHIRFKEKYNVIRDLKVLVSNVNDRSCEPYNDNDVTDLLEQNERLRAEIEKVKQHYKERSKGSNRSNLKVLAMKICQNKKFLAPASIDEHGLTQSSDLLRKGLKCHSTPADKAHPVRVTTPCLRWIIASQDETTRPSVHTEICYTTKMVQKALSHADAKFGGNSEKVNSETDTEILNVGDEQG
ncbi:hypothetical protein Tco_0701046 [Tanacetum coccineum]